MRQTHHMEVSAPPLNAGGDETGSRGEEEEEAETIADGGVSAGGLGELIFNFVAAIPVDAIAAFRLPVGPFPLAFTWYWESTKHVYIPGIHYCGTVDPG